MWIILEEKLGAECGKARQENVLGILNTFKIKANDYKNGFLIFVLEITFLMQQRPIFENNTGE